VRWDSDVSYSTSLALGNKPSSDDVTEAESECKEAKKKYEAAKNASPPDPNLSNLLNNYTAKSSTLATKKTKMEGADGLPLTNAANFTQDGAETSKKGLYALEQVDLFNILCIPPYNSAENIDTALISAAAAYCEKRRAMLLVDSPREWNSKEKAKTLFNGIGTQSKNAALFFPRLKQPNSLRNDQMEDFAPCGAVAGIFARTDMHRGVWKAPAGLDASLVGVPQLSVSLTDAENGELNPLGINCLRALPPAGRVVWGARTLQGDDRLASEWKYIPVRRTALFIEESLFRGLKWAVFEPNDEPLWSQIRLNAGAFMHGLFRQGAFQGATPREAYFVKCDRETTTQSEIDSGIVNVVVGFAPLKPAEFVVIKLQQIAGQVQT
jgi:phage tail sheath protein FI